MGMSLVLQVFGHKLKYWTNSKFNLIMGSEGFNSVRKRLIEVSWGSIQQSLSFFSLPSNIHRVRKPKNQPVSGWDISHSCIKGCCSAASLNPTMFSCFQGWPTQKWSGPWRRATECSALKAVPPNSMKSCRIAGKTSLRTAQPLIICRVSWKISTQPQRASTSSSHETFSFYRFTFILLPKFSFCMQECTSLNSLPFSLYVCNFSHSDSQIIYINYKMGSSNQAIWRIVSCGTGTVYTGKNVKFLYTIPCSACK